MKERVKEMIERAKERSKRAEERERVKLAREESGLVGMVEHKDRGEMADMVIEKMCKRIRAVRRGEKGRGEVGKETGKERGAGRVLSNERNWVMAYISLGEQAKAEYLIGLLNAEGVETGSQKNGRGEKWTRAAVVREAVTAWINVTGEKMGVETILKRIGKEVTAVEKNDVVGTAEGRIGDEVRVYPAREGRWTTNRELEEEIKREERKEREERNVEAGEEDWDRVIEEEEMKRPQPDTSKAPPQARKEGKK